MSNILFLILNLQGPKLAVADVNNDGLDDFYACGAKGQAGRMMIQQKDGSFKAVTPLYSTEMQSVRTWMLFFFDADGKRHT
jgi:hypothetical protein